MNRLTKAPGSTDKKDPKKGTVFFNVSFIRLWNVNEGPYVFRSVIMYHCSESADLDVTVHGSDS